MTSDVLKRRSFVAAVILVTAAMLTLPAAFGPLRVNDSYWIDWVWLDQFANELGRGIVYPRWLPMSHGGLGSPVFYYYPPLAFYAGSAFVLAGMGVYAALLATFFAGYALSGAGAYALLKGQSRSPLLGTVAFMIAPYHACNFYLRGAFAEFLATAFLPFVMLGLRLVEERKTNGIAIAALSYAALICSHLPLALLASLFLISPYLLSRHYREPRRLIGPAAALAAGIAIASIYLVPALMLEPYRDTAKLWENPGLQPQYWTFWDPGAPHAYPGMLVMGVVLALPLAILTVMRRSRWAVLGVVCVLLGVGLIPVIWELPLLRSVQFPFRILPIAELALAIALARVGWKPVLVGVPCLPLLFVTGLIVTGGPPSGGVPMAELRALHPDVPENLPPGERPYSWPSKWALGVAASHRRSRFSDGVTVEPTFYFPAWRLVCAGRPVPTFPDGATQLLSYRGQGCAQKLAWTVPEYIGALISLLGLLALVAVTLAGRFGQRTQRVTSSANLSRSMLPPETTQTIGPSSD